METNSGWTDFMVATAGATSALAGLVFVALSINLARILELPGVAARAGETIVLLAGALLGSLFALIPGLKPSLLGALYLVLWLPTWGVPTMIQIAALRQRQYYRLGYAIIRVLLYQAATIPIFLAGLSFTRHEAGGLMWFAGSVLLSLIVALFNAWILLVEILR
jgi:hypothetical protein